MNATTQLVFYTSWHVTPCFAICTLYCRERISYKLTVLVCRCVHGLAQTYLVEILQRCRLSLNFLVDDVSVHLRLRHLLYSVYTMDSPYHWRPNISCRGSQSVYCRKWRHHEHCQRSNLNLKSARFSVFFLICDCEVTEVLLHYPQKILCRCLSKSIV